MARKFFHGWSLEPLCCSSLSEDSELFITIRPCSMSWPPLFFQSNARLEHCSQYLLGMEETMLQLHLWVHSLQWRCCKCQNRVQPPQDRVVEPADLSMFDGSLLFSWLLPQGGRVCLISGFGGCKPIMMRRVQQPRLYLWQQEFAAQHVPSQWIRKVRAQAGSGAGCPIFRYCDKALSSKTFMHVNLVSHKLAIWA